MQSICIAIGAQCVRHSVGKLCCCIFCLYQVELCFPVGVPDGLSLIILSYYAFHLQCYGFVCLVNAGKHTHVFQRSRNKRCVFIHRPRSGEADDYISIEYVCIFFLSFYSLFHKCLLLFRILALSAVSSALDKMQPMSTFEIIDFSCKKRTDALIESLIESILSHKLHRNKMSKQMLK